MNSSSNKSEATEFGGGKWPRERSLELYRIIRVNAITNCCAFREARCGAIGEVVVVCDLCSEYCGVRIFLPVGLLLLPPQGGENDGIASD